MNSHTIEDGSLIIRMKNIIPYMRISFYSRKNIVNMQFLIISKFLGPMTARPISKRRIKSNTKQVLQNQIFAECTRSHRLAITFAVQIARNEGRQNQENQGDDGDDEHRTLGKESNHSVFASCCICFAAVWHRSAIILRAIDATALQSLLDFIECLLMTLLVFLEQICKHRVNLISRIELAEDNCNNHDNADYDHRDEKHSKKTFAILCSTAASDSSDEHNDAADNDHHNCHRPQICRRYPGVRYFLKDLIHFAQK